MKKYFLLALLAIGLMTSCQKENYLENAVNAEPGFTVTAAIEEMPQTRTQLSPSGSVYKTFWSENDAISVFYNGSHWRYLLSSGHNTPVAEFSWVPNDNNVTGGIDSEIASTVFVGVYPFSSSVSVSNKGDDIVIHTVIPSSQTFAEGSFGLNASPMVAVNDNNTPVFSFKNVGSVMQMPLKGNAVIVSAVLESKSHKIAGNAVVTAVAANNYVPVVDVENGVSSVSLSCGEGIQLDSENPTNFHFVLAPGTYEANDLVVKFYDSEGNYFATEITAANTFKRSIVHPFSARTYVVNGTEEVDLWVKAEADASMDADRIMPAITSINDAYNWVVELKNQPNTLSLLEEAVANIALKNFKGAYEVLNGIPGFKKEVVTFEATGVHVEKIDYTGVSYLKSFIGDINNINDIESLVDFIKEFDKVYTASGLKDKLDNAVGSVSDLVKHYIPEFLKPLINPLLGKVKDYSMVDMLISATEDPTSNSSKILNYLFSQDAFLNFVKSSLTTIVEGIEVASRELIDGSNQTVKEAAIALAKTNAILNARTNAVDQLWTKFDNLNAANLATLDASAWGLFKKLVNNVKVEAYFYEHEMGDVHQAFKELIALVEEMITYDKGKVVYAIEEIADYKENVDWWIISMNE